MRRPPRTWLPLLLAACAHPSALADVVHLANGRTIEGRVVAEDAERVVVRTGTGRVTIPRRDVDRVEREGEPRTLLREARQAAAGGDVAGAARLYDAAAAAGDAGVAAIASTERAALDLARGGAAREEERAPAADDRRPGDDPFVEVEREALLRELEAAAAGHPELARRLAYELYQRGERRHAAGDCRLAASDFARAAPRLDAAEQQAALRARERRCRLEVAARALRGRDAELARAAAAPVVDDPQLGVRAAYLLGRAEERLRRARPAREAFRRALGGVVVPPDHDLPALRELARLAAAGIRVDATSPGLAPGWRCTQTRSFSVLHEQPLADGFPEELEEVRAEVVARLGLRVDEDARIALFLFPDDASYQQAPGARAWSAGHATRLQGEGEMVPTIYLHAQGDASARLRHELAHIVVGDALDDALLPMWAAEGVAVHAEPEGSRRRWREQARALHRAGELRPVGEALGQMLLPLSDDQADMLRFYAQASVLFDVLAGRVGVERALGCARRINTDGPEGALRSVGLSLGAFERSVEAALAP